MSKNGSISQKRVPDMMSYQTLIAFAPGESVYCAPAPVLA